MILVDVHLVQKDIFAIYANMENLYIMKKNNVLFSIMCIKFVILSVMLIFDIFFFLFFQSHENVYCEYGKMQY